MRVIIESLFLNVNEPLKKHRDLFLNDITILRPQRLQETHELSKKGNKTGYKLTRVYWPRYTGKFSHEGFNLKDGMGSVSIEVIYRSKEGDKFSYSEVSHSFRYFNTDHSYIFHHQLQDDDKPVNAFSFRYDKDLRDSASPNDPEEHMQMMEHHVPRFVLKDSSLDSFLNLVRETCFQVDRTTDPVKLVDARVAGFYA